MKFIPASDVIDEVKEKLSTIFESNMIDDSVLYNRIPELLQKFRLNINPVKFTVLEVCNSKVDLPEDFYRACTVLGCFSYTQMGHSRYEETYELEEREVCELNVCETVCDVCHDDCGNMFRIVQKFNRYPDVHVHNEFEVLNVTKNSRPFCADNCMNFMSNSPNTIEIKNSTIHTEFEEGMIYLEYITKLETADDYLIPDQKTVTAWIKADLIHEIFQTLYYNGEDYYNRYQSSKQDLNIKEINALNVIKRPEITELYNLSNHLIARYNIVRNNVEVPPMYYGYCPINYASKQRKHYS